MTLKTGLWLPTAVLAASLAWSQQGVAVEAMASAELASHCNLFDDPDAEDDRIFCTRYVQGFIDGAVATDVRVTNNVADEFSGDESFGQRAARTRIGKRLERFQTSYAEFCLGEPLPLAEVVQHVVAATAKPEMVETHPLARDLVYRVLRDDYPCELTD